MKMLQNTIPSHIITQLHLDVRHLTSVDIFTEDSSESEVQSPKFMKFIHQNSSLKILSKALTQNDVANGAPEAVDVVVELKSFDYHGSASTSCKRRGWLEFGVRVWSFDSKLLKNNLCSSVNTQPVISLTQ